MCADMAISASTRFLVHAFASCISLWLGVIIAGYCCLFVVLLYHHLLLLLLFVAA